jgi:hypothetical protein
MAHLSAAWMRRVTRRPNHAHAKSLSPQTRDQVVSRRHVTEIDAEADQSCIVLGVGVIGIRIAHHGSAEVQQHRVTRRAFAACIRRRAADPHRGDGALAQARFQIGRALNKGTVARLAHDEIVLLNVEAGPQLGAEGPVPHRLRPARPALGRVEDIMKVRPVLERIFICDRADPHHQPADAA